VVTKTTRGNKNDLWPLLSLPEGRTLQFQYG